MSERVWEIVCDSFPKLLYYGVTVTLPLTAVSFILALIIAVVVALIQHAKVPVLRQLCRFYIWIVRGTPLLVQLYLVYYGLPKAGIVFDAIPAAIFVFSFNEGAYMAETMRGCIEGVNPGQIEAGYCVGLNYVQIMWHVVLPQAFRTAFPALSNSLISMLKGTSLAATITVMDMFRQAQVINGRVYESLALYTEVALIYLAFCTILTWLQGVCEKRLGAYGGHEDAKKTRKNPIRELFGRH